MIIYVPTKQVNDLLADGVPGVSDEFPGFFAIAAVGERIELTSLTDDKSGSFVPAVWTKEATRLWCLNRHYLLTTVATYVLRVGGRVIARVVLSKLAEGPTLVGVRVTYNLRESQGAFGAGMANYRVGEPWPVAEPGATRFDRDFQV